MKRTDLSIDYVEEFSCYTIFWRAVPLRSFPRNEFARASEVYTQLLREEFPS